MLSHYIKMALVVLWRRKFMAFVNIFGIVVTLLTLIVAVSVLDSVLSPQKAARHTDHYLVVNDLCFKGERSTRNGGVGYEFYKRYLLPMQTPDKFSYATNTLTGVVYRGGQKMPLKVRRTDAVYSTIMQHKLLDGRWYDQEDVAKGQFVAVINEATKERHFPGESALNKSITVNSQTFSVIGVVEDEPSDSYFAHSDIWVPLTTASSDNYTREWIGDGQVLLWVDDTSKRDAMATELQSAVSQFEHTPDPTLFNRALLLAKSPLDIVSNFFVGQNCTSESHAPTFIAQLSILAIVFMILPVINMINLNVSRILERAPEIGLRKAAGASNRLLVGQFLVETLVVTAIGGLVAFALSPIVLSILNHTLIRYGELSMNIDVLLVGLGLILVFGFMSGAYPAWRMSKLSPANALRGGHRHD